MLEAALSNGYIHTHGHRAAEIQIDSGLTAGARTPWAPATERERLPFTFAELAAQVDAAGSRKWLLRGIWPAGDYGVHAAESKAQKTWNAADLALSVASGTPWLGAIPVDLNGPVLTFMGEGGKTNIVRRVRAITEARNVTTETLPLVVCDQAPHLRNTDHLNAMADKIDQLRPVLVIIDPFYLAARGANLADLFAMGELLEAPQRICQDADASLMVVHHFNRRTGRGSDRMSGAGAAEWGSVLISAQVMSRQTDPVTGATDVVTELDIIAAKSTTNGYGSTGESGLTTPTISTPLYTSPTRSRSSLPTPTTPQHVGETSTHLPRANSSKHSPTPANPRPSANSSTESKHATETPSPARPSPPSSTSWPTNPASLKAPPRTPPLSRHAQRRPHRSFDISSRPIIAKLPTPVAPQ